MSTWCPVPATLADGTSTMSTWCPVPASLKKKAAINGRTPNGRHKERHRRAGLGDCDHGAKAGEAVKIAAGLDPTVKRTAVRQGGRTAQFQDSARDRGPARVGVGTGKNQGPAAGLDKTYWSLPVDDRTGVIALSRGIKRQSHRTGTVLDEAAASGEGGEREFRPAAQVERAAVDGERIVAQGGRRWRPSAYPPGRRCRHRPTTPYWPASASRPRRRA